VGKDQLKVGEKNAVKVDSQLLILGMTEERPFLNVFIRNPEYSKTETLDSRLKISGMTREGVDSRLNFGSDRERECLFYVSFLSVSIRNPDNKRKRSPYQPPKNKC